MIIISRDNGKITVTEYGIVHCIFDENEPTPDRPDLTYGEAFDRDLLLADYFTEENIISVRVVAKPSFPVDDYYQYCDDEGQ
jgi:hypothetical protein